MKYLVQVDLYADGNWEDDKEYDSLEAAENRIDFLMRVERKLSAGLSDQPGAPKFAEFRAVPVGP